MEINQNVSTKPISEGLFNLIITQLEEFYILSLPFKASLKSMLKEVTYKKGSHILNAGAVQSRVWFTVNGLLQEIAVDKYTFATKTTWFWFGFSFVYAAPGFFDQEPAEVTINVVKDSLIAYISYEDWNILKATFQETGKLTEILRTKYETARKLHLSNINSMSTGKRYSKYEAKINLLVQHIQLKHIAEYIGMSTDTLGKLHRKHVKEKQPVP